MNQQPLKYAVIATENVRKGQAVEIDITTSRMKLFEPTPDVSFQYKDGESTAKAEDMVNHPSHYNDGKIEVMAFIRDKKLNFARGSVVKYTSRAGKKKGVDELEDLKKAQWYIAHEIEMIEAARAGREPFAPNDLKKKQEKQDDSIGGISAMLRKFLTNLGLTPYCYVELPGTFELIKGPDPYFAFVPSPHGLAYDFRGWSGRKCIAAIHVAHEFKKGEST